MPKYAARSFKSWFREREKRTGKTEKATGKKVILWADTFNNNFLPQTLVAGVEVLEAAGFEVIVPRQSLCCGRPLYDFGMLVTAKKMLLQILDALHDEIRDGIPIVGLEPSCVAVFRDELHNLFPRDEQASRLSVQVFTLSEFLQKKAPDFKIPALHRKAIVHGHCHHKSIMKMDCEKAVLKKTGLDFEILPTTCCGMAGYFGYEKGKHYDVSIQAGELMLLPRVREAEQNTLIVTNGFSCREQIEQETSRKGLHLAQVLQMALREKDVAVTDLLPERTYVDEMQLKNPHKLRNRLIVVGCMLVLWCLAAKMKKLPWQVS
jgi:Fe-S oxidoreductase